MSSWDCSAEMSSSVVVGARGGEAICGIGSGEVRVCDREWILGDWVCVEGRCLEVFRVLVILLDVLSLDSFFTFHLLPICFISFFLLFLFSRNLANITAFLVLAFFLSVLALSVSVWALTVSVWALSAAVLSCKFSAALDNTQVISLIAFLLTYKASSKTA